jgi:hypothetical protein
MKPETCNKLMSQIDLMPTLFGLLHFDYQSKFFGEDVFRPDYKPRAFIATYQDLGLIKDNVLTILSPKQQVKQFDLSLNKKENSAAYQIYYDEKPLKSQRTDLINQTIAFYQSASYLLKEKEYQFKDLNTKKEKLYAKVH